MNEEKRKHIFAGRRAGMSPDAKEKLSAKETALTWSGICRRCHTKIKGTIEECRAHKCADNPILPTVD
jgi:hypothetical protein